MKTITNPKQKSYRVAFNILVIAMIVIGSLVQTKNWVTDEQYKATVVILPALFTLFWFTMKQKGHTFGEVIEILAIGQYEPEDERDVLVKMNAAMAAFRAIMFICWVVIGEQFIVNQGLTAIFSPVFLLALLIAIVGTITFRMVMSKQGVSLK